ncbi:MAG: cellulase family glycosylhydrolase [Capsulimonadaceae bacterium]|nr:cellulase family glycosylhydrolase [Capsulimonadaceae bacterium]
MDRITYIVTLCIAVLMACSLPGRASTTSMQVDDFATVSAWSSHADGGQIMVSPGEKLSGGAQGTMRLQYPNEPVHWGNAVRDVALPPNTSAVLFDVKVLSADPGAAGYLWFWEKDGDGWNAPWYFDSKHPGQIPVGWSHVRVPITSFKYDPRGNKIKEPLTINRFMIGFGAGRADVEISNLRWEIQDTSGAAVLSTTPGLKIERTPKGSVAILKDAYVRQPGDSDPDLMASTLRAAGYGVTLLRAGDVADPLTLTAANFDVLIFPYGPRYPFAANKAIRAFIHQGGSFLSTGGYAFDDADGFALPTVATFDSPSMTPLNARYVKSGDMMPVGAGEIPVFDPGNPLIAAESARAAADQNIIPAFQPAIQGPIEGYAASAVLGDGNAIKPRVWARRIPLLMTYDQAGRERGALGAIVYNYGGPYDKSAWAIFGATNVDLFSAAGPLQRQLPSIVDALVAKRFLHTLQTDFRRYEPGEVVNASVVVENQGATPLAARVTFAIADRKGASSAPPATQDVVVAPHTHQTVVAAITPKSWNDDLYTVTATLEDGGTGDQVKSGYTVPQNTDGADEFKLTWKGNYFRDGDRPVLAAGTNMTSSVLNSDLENPVQWDKDLQRVRESGLSFVRLTHGNPWYNILTQTGTEPTSPPSELPKQYLRNIDSFIALARRHHLIVLYDMVDYWTQLGITPEHRDIQREACRLLAAHFKGVPGIVFDLSNEPMLKNGYRRTSAARKADYEAQWNAFLQARYGSNEALNAAWGKTGLSLGSIPLDGDATDWSNRHSADYEDFFADLLNKWKDAVLAGVHAADPSRITLIGFIQGYGETNKLRNEDGLTQASMHSYAPVSEMRNDLQMFDHRAVGQGVSLTEYGDVATHEQRAMGVDSLHPDVARFVATGHTVFGEGGSLFESWIWKDMDDIIFPWGVNYAGNGPRKTSALAVRNLIALVRSIRPEYAPAPVYVVVAPEAMSGVSGAKAVNASYAIFDDLRSRQVDFGVIDDHHLAQLPPSARVLIFPAAMIVPDDAYEALLKFARGGGTVCIAGDFSFGPERTRTNLDRLREFGGFTTGSTKGSTGDPWTGPFTIHPTTATIDNALRATNRLGEGMVIATLDPSAGIASPSTSVYAPALAKLAPRRYTADTPALVSRRAEERGGRVYFLCNPTSNELSVTISCETTPVLATLAPNGVGLVRYDASGNVIAVESQGLAKIGSTRVPMTGHFALIAPENQPLMKSRSLVAIPFGPGTLDLTGFPNLRDATARAVDFRDGRIVTSGNGKLPTITVDDATGFDFRVIAPAASQDALTGWLRDQIELRGAK